MNKNFIISVLTLSLFNCATKSEKSEIATKNAYVPSAEIQLEIEKSKACTEEFLSSEYGQWVMNPESDPTLNQVANLSRIPKVCSTQQAIRATRFWSKVYKQESIGAYLFSTHGTLAKDLQFVRQYLETQNMSVGENLIHMIGLNRIAKAIADTKSTKKYNKSIESVAKEFKNLSEVLENKWVDIFSRTTAHESTLIKTEIAMTSVEELLGTPEQQTKLPAEEVTKIKSLNKESEIDMFTNWQKAVHENKICLAAGTCHPCVVSISNEICTDEKKSAEEQNLKNYLFAELILPKYTDGFEKIKISTQRLSAIVKKF